MKYTYYVVTRFVNKQEQNGTTSNIWYDDCKIDSIEKIRAIEKQIKEKCDYQSVLVTNFILLKEEPNGCM